jgi:hypothetical protein
MTLSRKSRIATWNLERPLKISKRVQLALQKIEALNPDIIILTETSSIVDLGSEYYAVKSKEILKCPNEQWVTIWTRWPIVRELKTYDDTKAICALIAAPFGNLIVYGTILPYHMAGVNGGKYPEQNCTPWELHEKSIVGLGIDIKTYLAEYQEIPICVAGDFNQTRDNCKGGYGLNRLRLLLSEILRGYHLDCLTEENFGETGKLKQNPRTGKTRRNIDHILVSSKWHSSFQNLDINAWDHFTDQGVFMSDHNGVFIDFNL